MLRVYSIFLRLFVVRDITGFVHEIDHDVGLPPHVRRACNDFTNDGENTIGRAVTLNEAFFELLPVCFGACTPKYLKA